MQISTAGRLMLYRSHGKLAFAKLMDSTAQIQLMFHRDQCKIDVSTSQNEAELLDVITGE
jgi:lysyl-tRNA synthetase class II